MAGTQPLARKRISVMRPSAIFSVSFSTSPQAGLSNRAAASGLVTVPALRGF
jgi:hypothetical protein